MTMRSSASPRNDHANPDVRPSPDGRLEELRHLRRRLETLPVIEQSKGILVRHYGIDPEAAFELLRRWACDNNRKLHEISQQIVAAAPSSNDPQPTLNRFLHDLRSGVK
jgi:hypothetical protein